MSETRKTEIIQTLSPDDAARVAGGTYAMTRTTQATHRDSFQIDEVETNPTMAEYGLLLVI